MRRMRTLILAGIASLAFIGTSEAQVPTVPCEAQLATAGGTAWTCPLGAIRNIVDVEGGTVFYGPNGLLDRGKLRLNLSGGETVDQNTGELVREAIALNPDVGGCTLIYDGRKTLLASFCPQGFGERSGIHFYVEPIIHTSSTTVTVQQVQVDRLRGRVNRLQRKLNRLSRAFYRYRRHHG